MEQNVASLLTWVDSGDTIMPGNHVVNKDCF